MAREGAKYSKEENMSGTKDKVVGKFIQEKARIHKDRTFLFYKDETLTYAQVDSISNQFANGFKSMGLIKNDKIAIMMINHPYYLHVWFGAAKLGIVEVPINTAYKGELLKHLINNSESKALFLDSEFLDRLLIIQDDLPKLERIICRGEIDQTVADAISVPVSSIDDFFDYPADPIEVDVLPSDPVAFIYTSGTTGLSKGVVCPNNYYLHTGRLVAELRDARSDDILYTFLPLFHINAQLMTVLASMVADAQMVLNDHFSASNFWNEIRRYGATQFNYLGAVMTILSKQEPKPEDDEVKVRYAFGAACPPDVMEKMEKKFGFECLEGFGMSEIGLVVHDAIGNRRRGSCGKVLDEYFEVKLFDDDDNEVATGEIGEIVVRPKMPYIMMTEYYNMPDKTLEAFRNLWFHTGDYAKKDDDEFFYFVDRKKDAMRRRGENISSFEVEKVINTHPSVLESAVFAVPSELGEDEVMTAVVLKPDMELSPVDLIEFCNDRMAHFAVPRYVDFVAELPKTPTNRIEKYKMRQVGITETTWDREKAGVKIKK
jgi:crotonobetaine/carnitine-CoA ligase